MVFKQPDVSPATRAERALEQSEERYRHLVESSNDWVWEVDAEATYTFVGPQCREIFGYEPEELLGKKPFDLMPAEEARRVAEVFGAIAGARKPFRALQNINTHKSGRPLILETNGVPIFDELGTFLGYRGMDRDISERKRHEQALRETEERFRMIANSAPVMIWMAGPDKLCTYFNKRWLDFTGRPVEAQLGSGWTEGVHPDDLPGCMESYTRSFDRRDPFRIEYRLKPRDGEYRWIVDTGVPRFNSDGSFAGYIGSCVDDTDRRAAAEALRSLSGRLIKAQEQERRRIARELHDDINQRLAMVAVELQQLHMSPNLSAGQRKRIEKLFKDTTDITSGIQALSHQLHSTRLDYLGLVPAIQGFCDELARQRQVRIDFVHSDVPVSLSADVALALFRVTQEALHNAVKYSGVRVFEVRLLETDNHIELAVRDSGVGFGLDAAMQGNGLGLISMRERILPLKGAISIVSKPRQGTEINVRFPVQKSG